jgi:hypothetical protein
VVDISGFEDVPANDEGALAKAVASQPVSVAVCVNPTLQVRKSMLYLSTGCVK